jgi:Lrp/AsnC family transcriptional regulator, leucine-responsive regulatory protein
MPAKRRSTWPNGFGRPTDLLDEVNVRLLEHLQADPRMTMAELARRVGMSAPAVTERVQRLEEQGVIAGYRMELDPGALGLPIAAYVRVRPGPRQLQKIAELAQGMPEVVECHRITGEDCFLIRVHVAAVDQLESVLDAFLPYGQTTTSIVQSSPVPRRGLPLRPSGPNEGEAGLAPTGEVARSAGGGAPTI